MSKCPISGHYIPPLCMTPFFKVTKTCDWQWEEMEIGMWSRNPTFSSWCNNWRVRINVLQLSISFISFLYWNDSAGAHGRPFGSLHVPEGPLQATRWGNCPIHHTLAAYWSCQWLAPKANAEWHANKILGSNWPCFSHFQNTVFSQI